ncbi:hypothetical protein FN894_03925 [Salmonella enterica subsp. enterica]|uniref:Eaa protein n=2 Tax=Salmonella enterica TaxID=28901 RepID=A0A5T5IEF4_SALEB|nr:hypothetical protein [Salmonella enterica subsp. enterica]EAY0418083.1 hypothetical protein [Salmonella enterica]EBM1014814.1 hypothetical protein [Salmonella enterica subsp. enterica serovar Paratyphi B]ECH1096151.1 hypothetical protein [Salmonella enterica subsp. enterica serovar Java]EDH3989853.1 hypothetical protein [Salmonella enterica subsp. enterica serovar Westminster]
MTTITKERIELFIKNPLENGLTRGEQMELARIAMASLEAKPVRYLNKFSGVCVTLEQQSNAADDVAVYIPLYTAQPAPVVPDEMATSDDMNLYQKSFAQGYNACRAAMLQGSQPVSNHDELPYAQVKAVADLYALCWQSGEVVTYTPDQEKATIWLNNYSGTCVQEYVKLERLQEALAGNSPVIPDDWVMVPKEPTRQMMAQGHFAMKGTDRGKFRRIYQAMITAASALNKGEY